MKIVKTYDYQLSEKTLEKDIDKFIRDAKTAAASINDLFLSIIQYPA